LEVQIMLDEHRAPKSVISHPVAAHPGIAERQQEQKEEHENFFVLRKTVQRVSSSIAFGVCSPCGHPIASPGALRCFSYVRRLHARNSGTRPRLSSSLKLASRECGGSASRGAAGHKISARKFAIRIWPGPDVFRSSMRLFK